MIYRVKLKTLESAKTFVSVCDKFYEDIDYVIGRYRIDAKSIMGILSTDLEREASVEIHSDDNDCINKFKCLINKFRTDIKENNICG